jgi:tetratricopeptide (TPR) repeat protein
MRPRFIIIIAALLAAAMPSLPAAAADPAPAKPRGTAPAQDAAKVDDAQKYQHCIWLARQKPEDGWEESLSWGSLGGGEPARQCGAIALVGLKQYAEAATRLEDLARSSHSSPMLRAGMLAQAGQAWLLAGKPERAYAAQTTALQLVPGAPDLLVDRAESLAEAKNYRDAVTDLDQALTVGPDRVDALTFRATAKRYLDDLKGAGEDVAKALSIDPQNPDAWLESGIIKRLNGNAAQARQDWLKVLQIAPKSPAADAARRNIEILDVKAP